MAIALEIQEEVMQRTKRYMEVQKEVGDQEIKDTANRFLTELLAGNYASVSERLEVVNYTFNSMRKLGILQPILDDRSITEVMINGPDHIFIERSGRLYETGQKFKDRKELLQ